MRDGWGGLPLATSVVFEATHGSAGAALEEELVGSASKAQASQIFLDIISALLAELGRFIDTH